MSHSIDEHEINNDNDDGHQDVIVQTASREAADAASFYESAYVIDDDDDTTNDVEFELESTITKKKQKDSNYNDTFNYNGNKSPSRKGNGKYHNHQTNNNEKQRIEGGGVESDEEDDLVETVAMEISIAPDRRNKCYLCCYRRHCRYQKIFCCFKQHSNEFDLGEDDDNNVPSVPQTKQNSQTKQQQRPTNEKLLSIAFLSFFGFTCLQALAAYLAQSEAMMGDSVAMAVDAFTYLFNLCAERSKNQQDDNDEDDDNHNQLNEQEERIVIVTKRLQHRKKRKTKLILEIAPPLISVTTLVIVTTIILNEAIKTLVLDAHRDETMQDNPNLIVMLVFSTLNLLVDAGNIFFFAKADHLTGYSTMDDDDDDGENGYDIHGYDDDDGDGDDDVEFGVQMIPPTKRRDTPSNRKQGHRSSNSSTNTASSSISTRTQKRNAIGRVKQNLARMKKERRRRRGGAYSHIAINDGDDDGNDNDDYTSLEHELVLIESEDDLRIEGLSAEQKIRTIGTPQSGKGASIDEEEDDLDEIDEDGFSQNPAEENEMDDVDHDDGYKEHNTDANLNMCSAYTHVFADTIRSIAVLVAAILAEVSDIVTSEVADAAAAVVVSGVILLALLPLFAGLRKSIQELNAIRREEKDEKMIESCLGEQAREEEK